MSDWWSYGLADFLLFSPRTYWRMFELHNAAMWPQQVPVLAMGLALILLAAWRPRAHGRLIALLLAIQWAHVAWSFLWLRYATINWAAVYVAPVFAAEGALLLVAGTLLDRLAFDRGGWARSVGLSITIFAVAGYPWLAPLSGRPIGGAEIFGIAPDPTVIGTLGLLLLARGKLPILLLAIPLLWCAASAATLWAMEAPEAWILPGAALVVVVAGVLAGLRRTADAGA
jgi:hypothetical protein